MSDEERRLVHAGGGRRVDAVEMERLTSWIEANIRLGQSVIITIDQYGNAICRAAGEADANG